jgi:hypothetical protein
MVMLARLTALGLLIQVVALLSFIAIAKTGLAFPGKTITWSVFLVAMLVYLIEAVELLSVRELVFLAVSLSVGSTTVHQVLGFAFFPGLVKEVPLLSMQHLRAIGNETIFFLVCNVAGIMISAVVRRVLKR